MSRRDAGSDERSAPDASEWNLPRHPACPFCERRDTALHSPFGSAASVATYWCNSCRTAFEHIKWTGPGPA